MPALIDHDEDTVFACYYQINQLDFIIPEKTVSMKATNIMGLEIQNDFEMNVRSIIKLTIRVDIRQKLWILQHKEDIVVKMELDRIGVDMEANEILFGPEEVFKGEFKVYLNDDDEAMDTSSLENSMAANEGDEFSVTDTETQSYYEGENIMDIYLFESSQMTASMKTCNKVVTEEPMQHILGEMLTESGHKKVLMSPIENDEVYQEMLLPSNSAYNSLAYLDQYYGFYKQGACIFYDVDTLYIVNPNGKPTAKAEGEWIETDFLITADNRTDPGNGMVRKPDQEINYVNVPEENVSPQKPSTAMNDQLGSEAKIVITDDITIDTVEADQSYMNQRNQYTVYQKKDDNKYTGNMTKVRSEENDCVLYITGENFDINAFKPNKVYKMIFGETAKEEKYGAGKVYRITYAYHNIKTESEQRMKAHHWLIFKKCSPS